MRANNKHRTLALKDFQDQDIKAVLERPAFCQKKHHEKEELKFFCKGCKVPRSEGDYHAGTPIESVVYCLIKLFVVRFGRFGSIWTHAYYSPWTPWAFNSSY